VALLNSSKHAAKRAIEYYRLDLHVNATAHPHSLAADREVDLVVCTTSLDVHYDTIKPSIEAGHSVLFEWPVAEHVRRTTDLAVVARETVKMVF